MNNGLLRNESRLKSLPCMAHPLTRNKELRKTRVVCVVSTVALCFAFALLSASAVETNAIVSSVTGGAQKIYEIIESLVIPICICCFAYNAVKMLIGDQRDMSTAKKYMLVCVIVLALVFLAPPIVNEVKGWFGTGHWQEVFSQ